jgi:parvulin-like peptidyl-prolyl cis-trans isomerase-like protein
VKRRFDKREVLLAAALLSGGLACGNCRSEKAVLTPGDDVVLAEVNGTKVTERDVELAAASMFGQKAFERMKADARKNLLASVVQSRAIAQKREAELSAVERAELDKKVSAYREEVLVRQYLEQHTRSEPVTASMVEDYYKDHPERFGGAIQRSYEMLLTSRELAPAERDGLLALLKDASAHKDWAAWALELQKRGQPIAYRTGTDGEEVLHPALRALVLKLAQGEAAPLTFVEGKAYLIRVTRETEKPAKALSDVSGDIRKSLAPAQIKKSVQEATAVVMKDAKVVYR